MKLRDLFKNRFFIASINIELALYGLLEESGIPKEDILQGVYDKQIAEANEKIYKQFNNLMEELNE